MLINFLRQQGKKIYNRAKQWYCDATIFVFRFFIIYLSKKIETEKWLKAADCPVRPAALQVNQRAHG